MDLLAAILIVFLLFLYLSGVVVIVYYWARKTRRYLMPSLYLPNAGRNIVIGP
jgi:hypothetical protein